MLDGENFVTDWDDSSLLPYLLPPPDHGQDRPLLQQCWSNGHRKDPYTNPPLDRSGLGPVATVSIPPLTISLDHQVRDDFDACSSLRRPGYPRRRSNAYRRITTYDIGVAGVESIASGNFDATALK
jgi:hypothetical protein